MTERGVDGAPREAESSALHRTAGIYLAAQAAAVLAWWALLLAHPPARVHFQPGESEAALLAFWLPDLLLVAFGSALAGVLSFRRSRFLTPVLWFTAGGLAYATLYCLAASLASDRGWMGFVLMAPAALLTGVLAAALLPDSAALFREARSAGAGYNVLKTSVQIFVFWSTLLFVVPALLVRLQREIGVPLLDVAHAGPVAAAVFAAFSALGLWSGVTMARHGDGTPLPVDSTRKLVTRGPYAWVRNPMAVAGLGQGTAAALYTGSVLVLGYVLLGTLIWQCIVRPLEEEHLLRQFGAEYEAYRGTVRCWVPAASACRVPFAA